MATNEHLRLRHGDAWYDPRGIEREIAARVPADATPAEWPVFMFWPRGIAFRRPQGTAAGVEAIVEVNHGRWIVRCPFCPGAQLASRSDPRFFCVDCLHAGSAAEGKFVRTSWPASTAAIEEALLVRPTANQHWLPDETPEDLRDENAAAGLPAGRAAGGGGR